MLESNSQASIAGMLMAGKAGGSTSAERMLEEEKRKVKHHATQSHT